MSEKLLGSGGGGLLFIVSAPAGTGKSTLVQRLLEEFPKALAKSISYTTRQPRSGERAGEDYHFITEATFHKKVETGDFLEYEQLFGAYYGTGKREVDDLLAAGKEVILVIDVKGAATLRALPFYRGRLVSLFLAPPSLGELRRRLEGRGSEKGAEREARLSLAEEELRAASQYDYLVVNDDLEVTYQIMRSICIAEKHKRRGEYVTQRNAD